MISDWIVHPNIVHPVFSIFSQVIWITRKFILGQSIMQVKNSSHRYIDAIAILQHYTVFYGNGIVFDRVDMNVIEECIEIPFATWATILIVLPNTTSSAFILLIQSKTARSM